MYNIYGYLLCRYRCEREDNWGCNAYGPSDQEEHGFLPTSGCGGEGERSPDIYSIYS